VFNEEPERFAVGPGCSLHARAPKLAPARRTIIKDLISDEEYANFQTELAQYPEKGGPMAECGGIRKTRIALPGKGKSGGARVIYYYLKNHQTIYLLYAFTKGEADNLSAEGKKSMREWSQQIRASYHE
jgi:hypothetical protein